MLAGRATCPTLRNGDSREQLGFNDSNEYPGDPF
jgi:hypothetical protein